jgi:hypothetical protein
MFVAFYVVLATRIIDLAVSEASSLPFFGIRGSVNASKVKSLKKSKIRKLKKQLSRSARKLEEEEEEEECAGPPPGASMDSLVESGAIEEIHKFSLNYCHCVSGCTENRDSGERDEIRSCYWDMLQTADAEEGPWTPEEEPEEPAEGNSSADDSGGEEEEEEEIDDDTQELMDMYPETVYYFGKFGATDRFAKAMKEGNKGKACNVLKCSAFCMIHAACGQGVCRDDIACARGQVKAQCDTAKAEHGQCDVDCSGAFTLSPGLVLMMLPVAVLSLMWC